MHIFFVTSKLKFHNVGGSCEEYDLIIKGLQAKGNKVTAVSVFSQYNDITDPLDYDYIEEKNIKRDQIGIQNAIYKILKKYEGQADAYHVDGHFFLYGAGLYRRLGGVTPVFAYFNREQISWPENVSALFYKETKKKSLLKRIKKNIRYYLEKTIGTWIASGIDYAWFTNPFLQQEYAKFGFRKGKPFKLIGDPIEYDKSLRKYNIGEDFYQSHIVKGGRVKLFFSSRMIAGKGFDLLLTAFSKIKNKDNFKLILGGTGPEENLVRQMIKDLKLEQYVTLPGWMTKEELHRQLMEADIFVQARWRQDMSSMSLTEAMIFGLPSIVPSGGGIAWVGGESSLTFDPDDPDDLARKIEQLGSNPELRSLKSKNVYKRMHENTADYKKSIPIIEKIIKEVVGIEKKKSLSLQRKIIRKCITLKNINWPWFFRYINKHIWQHYYFIKSKLTDIKYWEMDTEGQKIKLSFNERYHHQQAKSMAEGLDEPILFSIWKACASKVPCGNIIFDIGGYNGAYGITAAKANPNSKVIIVEPDQTNIEHIKKNIEINNINNIKVIEGVLSSDTIEKSFKIHQGGTGGHITSEKNGIKVKSYTIENLVEQENNAPISLMKFDIHGAEKESLISAKNIIKKTNNLAIILEFYPNIHEDTQFWSFLKEVECNWIYLYSRNDDKSKYYFVYKGPQNINN